MSILSQKRIRRAYIVASYLTLMFFVFRAAFVPQKAIADVIFGAILSIFVTMACVADSAVLGRAIPFEVRLPFSVTWAASMPIYLLRSRGWWGLLFLLTHVALLSTALTAVATAEVVRKLFMK